jgi:hypothetical protein
MDQENQQAPLLLTHLSLLVLVMVKILNFAHLLVVEDGEDREAPLIFHLSLVAVVDGDANKAFLFPKMNQKQLLRVQILLLHFL